MSMSIQGVLVDGERLQHWIPDEAAQADITAKLHQVAIDDCLEERDRHEFLDNALRALSYVARQGNHPGVSSQGAYVTRLLLESIGKPVHSNTFNPIGWNGIERMNTTLVTGGAPKQIVNSEQRSGPWRLADSDVMFFGGWDRVTQRSVASAIKQADPIPELLPLRELGRWLGAAIEADHTLWAWIA